MTKNYQSNWRFIFFQSITRLIIAAIEQNRLRADDRDHQLLLETLTDSASVTEGAYNDRGSLFPVLFSTG